MTVKVLTYLGAIKEAAKLAEEDKHHVYEPYQLTPYRYAIMVQDLEGEPLHLYEGP